MYFLKKNKKEKEIIDAYNEYFSHLSEGSDLDEASQKIWDAKQRDLFVNLLHKMSVYLDYDIDKVEIKNDCYMPNGISDRYNLQRLNAEHLQKVLSGKSPIMVQTFNSNEDTAN